MRIGWIFLSIFMITSMIGLVMSIDQFIQSGKELDAAKAAEKQAEKDLKELQVAKAEYELANKDLAYEYGMCVFYYKVPVEECNQMSKDKGLPLYEKYYGNGSWTIAGDPTPEQFNDSTIKD